MKYYMHVSNPFLEFVTILRACKSAIRGIVQASYYLDLPNFSCHLPFAAGAGAALSASATSSTVSWTVAMAASPDTGI